MSDDDLMVAKVQELSPLQIFFAKVAIITVAVLMILYGASYFIGSFIDRKADQLKILKGGPAFWGMIENKLYVLADEPDLTPEKKKKIVDALRRLSSKYKPYLDAINGDGAPGERKNR
jgi:hypothetical protein